MAKLSSNRFSFPVTPAQRVSAICDIPRDALCCFVFAHGAGAGMEHAFMQAVAEGLAARRIATLRYQFPFAENGTKRPDTPAVAHATVRAAVAQAAERLPGLPLFAGGKSFGGRMTSQAQAVLPLEGVQGLVFAGFPLHPPDRPSSERGEHLKNIRCPMLFLQGTRDKLAEASLIATAVRALGRRATLESVQDADHAFHVLVRSGRTDGEVLIQILEAIQQWMAAVIAQ